MKICLFSIPGINLGKHSVKDARLDEVDKISQSKKKTYIQVELTAEDGAQEADAILAPKQMRQDFILKDLEFIETRLARVGEGNEKILLVKLQNILEKEEFISSGGLSEEDKKGISVYPLLTCKPIILAESPGLENLDSLLACAVKESGFISFFTSGEKETRAWLIKNGTRAQEAAGAVHSDIQRGFIRAEIISFNDFIASGGENRAKQAGKLRLEQKDYTMQDADLVNFRFNK